MLTPLNVLCCDNVNVLCCDNSAEDAETNYLYGPECEHESTFMVSHTHHMAHCFTGSRANHAHHLSSPPSSPSFPPPSPPVRGPLRYGAGYIGAVPLHRDLCPLLSPPHPWLLQGSHGRRGGGRGRGGRCPCIHHGTCSQGEQELLCV